MYNIMVELPRDFIQKTESNGVQEQIPVIGETSRDLEDVQIIRTCNIIVNMPNRVYKTTTLTNHHKKAHTHTHSEKWGT